MAKSRTPAGRYTVRLNAPARRDLQDVVKKVSKAQRKRIGKKIAGLASNPRPHGAEKLSGSGNEYRIRDGNYRILYEIDDKNQLVNIGCVSDRKEAYKP